MANDAPRLALANTWLNVIPRATASLLSFGECGARDLRSHPNGDFHMPSITRLVSSTFVCLVIAAPLVRAQDAAPAATATPRVATLNAVDSRIYGSIRLEPTGKPNEYRAKLSVRGAPVDQQMPWEIRSGNCGENGQHVGSQAAFRTLSVRSDGTGDVNATLALPLVDGQTYSVNILASRSNRDRVVSCGVLTAAQ